MGEAAWYLAEPEPGVREVARDGYVFLTTSSGRVHPRKVARICHDVIWLGACLLSGPGLCGWLRGSPLDLCWRGLFSWVRLSYMGSLVSRLWAVISPEYLGDMLNEFEATDLRHHALLVHVWVGLVGMAGDLVRF